MSMESREIEILFGLVFSCLSLKGNGRAESFEEALKGA